MIRRSLLSVVIVTVLAAIGFLVAASAYAATPTLSLVNTSGDSMQINVNGDPNSGVMFYYNVGSSSGTLVTTLGSTDASGSFSTAINPSLYAVNSGNLVYVVVNGQQSAMQTWSSAVSASAPVLSQNSITLGLGQSMTVIAQSNAGVYMASNSNTSIASIYTNGPQVTVTGNQIGSTVASICLIGSGSNCANLSISVQSASVTTLSFSQNNLSLSSGGSQSVVIYGGGGTYSVSGNSNTSVVSTNLSGNTLTVYALAVGSATITVCDQNQSSVCGSIYVTVSSSGSSQSVTFGITNPTIVAGQSMNIALSGGSGYFVSSNANANIAQASVNGSTLTLYGASVGSDSITVCASSGGCNTLYVTVTNTSAVTQTTVTNSALLAEIQSLQSAVTQVLTAIQSIQSKLAQLASEVTGSAQSNTTSASATTASSATSYKFYNFLGVGSQGADVTALQERLTYEGMYSGSITGYYGSLTEGAVKKYQTAHGITPAGYVGPSTRAALNAGG